MMNVGLSLSLSRAGDAREGNGEDVSDDDDCDGFFRAPTGNKPVEIIITEMQVSARRPRLPTTLTSGKVRCLILLPHGKVHRGRLGLQRDANEWCSSKILPSVYQCNLNTFVPQIGSRWTILYSLYICVVDCFLMS